MSNYKSIEPGDVSYKVETVFHRHNLKIGTSSGNPDINQVTTRQFISHSGYFNHPITLSNSQISQSNNYYFLKSNFYQTGSGNLNAPVNPQEGTFDNPTYRHKFHGEKQGVWAQIPLHYTGDGIVRKSLKITDNTFFTSKGKNISIEDDGYGNLFSTNAHISQSNNHASSSENYIGNIFYDNGIIAITTTGSFSASMGYGNSLQNFTASFESMKNIHTRVYNLKLNANEFNMSNNLSITNPDNTSQVNPSISGSNDWRPYVNSIGLYDSNHNLVMVANLSQPIEKRDDVNLVFEVGIDF